MIDKIINMILLVLAVTQWKMCGCTGWLKMTDMKLTDQVAWREIGGHEIARHETGGQTTEK